MSNFMYQVMTNGIGGVNCGGVEGGYKYGDDTETKVNAKLLFVLLKNKSINIELGYLEKRPTFKLTQDKITGQERSTQVMDYFLTKKAVEQSRFILSAYEKKEGAK